MAGFTRDVGLGMSEGLFENIGDTDRAHESIRSALSRINERVKELAIIYRLDLE